MKIFSIILNLLKKERICVIPELNFCAARVKRTQSEIIKHSENERIKNDFANAYLERVRGILRSEKRNIILKSERCDLSRRPLKIENSAACFDELDVMISNLSSLNGLNVVERVNLNKRR